jgi:glycosyltransferase involved in cell wall biosynthesis
MTNTMCHTLDYSIVIPVYFNEGSLKQTMESIKREVIEQNPHYTCEVIFVDDGSGDNSLEELLRICQENPEIVKIIKLTRNFGQTNALLAGFAHAKGKCIIAISADGQDPPSLIDDMLNAHFTEGYDIVVCTRKGRDESYYRIITSKIFYSLMKKLTFPNMPKGGFDFFLLSERAMQVFLSNIDAHPFFQGQILWMGYRTKFIEYHRLDRITGKSRWTFTKKLTYLIDGVSAYSFFPLRVSSFAGALLALLGFLYAVIIFSLRLFWGNPIKGWAPLMILILVLGGFQLLMLGIVGEYIWRTLTQVRKRDLYIIDTIYDKRE